MTVAIEETVSLGQGERGPDRAGTPIFPMQAVLFDAEVRLI